MPDLMKMLPLLVAMRSMCDALLVEIAKEQEGEQAKAAKTAKTAPKKMDVRDHAHVIEPGFGPSGVCTVCGETVAREVKDG